MFIKCNNVGCFYDKNRYILKDITLDICRKETLAVLGKSGSGKSTFLKLISGILPVLEGSITIDDLSPRNYNKKGKLSYMFQKPTLFSHLNVEQNVVFPIRKGKVDYDYVREMLRKVGLEGYGNYYPKELSGGMEARVSLVRSFINKPNLLLLDEPFSSLDISWKKRLYLELQKFKEECETTVVIVTHDIQEALILSDAIVVLNENGQIDEKIIVKSRRNMADRLNGAFGFVKSGEFEEEFSEIQRKVVKYID